jgi:glycine oxidase
VPPAETECADLAREVAWQQAQGLQASLLDAPAAREIEPELGPTVQLAAYFADDGQVDPPALLRALVAAAARSARITIRSGATVQRLLVDGDRCVGVALDEGELRADAVVLAAGSWSSLVPGVPASLPTVKPVRGQILLLDERPPRLRTIVIGARAYVVPRGDGRVICGSTMENAGFRKEVTAGGLEAILSGALECVPSLAAAQFSSAWSNFRPHVDGDIPLVGPSPLAGLFLATGHHRNGILLSKVTADAVAAAVLTR